MTYNTNIMDEVKVLPCLFFSLISFIILGCADSNKNKVNEGSNKESMTLNISESLEFDIDSITSPSSSCMFAYTSKSKEFFYYLNKSSNEILCFDITNKNLLYKIGLKKEGPNGVGNINGFKVIDTTSFLIGSAGSKIAFIVDKNGNIIRKYNLKGFSSDNQSVSNVYNSTYYAQKVELIGNKLYFPQKVSGMWPKMTIKQLQGYSICLEFDTVSGVFSFLPFTFPKDYWNNGYHDLYYSRDLADNGMFVYSFTKDHNLYFTRDHVNVEKHMTKSKYIDKFTSKSRDEMTIEQVLKYSCENPSYGSIIYDSFRKVYYRFVFHGDEIMPNENLFKLVKNKRKISIMIIDKDFNVIGEKKLPDGRFLLTNFFVSRDGLYISNNHPDNPNIDENRLSFTLFKLKNL